MNIIEFKPVKKGMLEAIVTLKLPKWGNFIIRDLSYFVKGSQRWISYPSKVYEKDGQKKYWPHIAFESQETDKAFKDKVIETIEAHIKAHGDLQFPVPQSTMSKKSESDEVPF